MPDFGNTPVGTTATQTQKDNLRSVIGAQPVLAEGPFVDGDKTKLDAIAAPVYVLNYAERIAITDGIVGTTRVIQNDQIGIIWTLIDKPESSDDSWIGQPYTQNVDGSISVTMELADVSEIVPDANVLGQVHGRPTIGDAETTGGKRLAFKSDAVQGNTPGMIRVVSVKTLGSASFTVKSTTGYVATRNWAGVVTVYGNGVPANNISASLAVPASGAWSKSAPKEIYVWSCTAGNATQSGDLTYLNCDNNNLTSLDVSGLTALTYLTCENNNLTSLDVSGLTALISLSCNNNQITSLDVSGLTAPTFLSCDNNQISLIQGIGFEGMNAPSMVIADFSNNNLTTDAVWTFLNDFANANPSPNPINLQDNPCDGGTTLVEGVNHSAAETEALATTKGYTLTLS